MLYRRPQLSAESGLNDSSDQGVLLCSSILLQRLSSLLLLCSLVLGWHFPWREAEIMFLTLGLIGIYLKLGFLFRKSRKQIMRVLERLTAARGEAANCHPQNCNWVYELELNCSSQDDKGTTRQKINQMSIIFMAEVGGSPSILLLKMVVMTRPWRVVVFSCPSSSIPTSFID